jgi:menaquinone-dependent protoporphyrinogen oxidase
MMRVLVACASAHGSTTEVAGTVGDAVRSRGHEVTVADASSQIAGDDYDAFILGSAVRHGTWLPEMAGCVRRLRVAMQGKPAFLWLTCLRVLEPGGHAYVSDNYLPNLLTGALPFRRIGIFAGKLDAALLNRQEAWTFTFRYDGPGSSIALAGDHREWAAIRAWAEQVADDLG